MQQLLPIHSDITTMMVMTVKKKQKQLWKTLRDRCKIIRFFNFTTYMYVFEMK